MEPVKLMTEMVVKVIRMYDWLLDLFVLDFFVDNHWEKLPDKWRDSFVDMDPQHLAEILCNKPTKKVLPLSFLALLKSVEALSLPRDNLSKGKNKNNTENLDTCKTHPKLKNLFLKHVKLKKRHEISMMADIVVNVAAETGCKAVIDFGSGLGHLVRMLAYRDDLYAAGIECQTQLTQEARKLDLELEYTAKKHISKEAVSKLKQPLHFNVTLSSSQQLQDLPLPESMRHFGLIGLHPCGDLGPLLLKHFVESEHVKFLCVVGCCYMKLTCNKEQGGYPMSKFVKNLDGDLSYTSREIACHAIDTYCERLRKGNYEDLKIHAYRAALEKILVQCNPKLRHAPVRSIKLSDNMTFERYSTLALERLDLDLPIAQAVCSQRQSDLLQWRRVVTMYTLRLMLAPLVETLILLDRVLYVMENGFSCSIQPVFDPKLSPRNHIIVARR